jgi:predicted enzyme related to lactoylglutathione lyase
VSVLYNFFPTPAGNFAVSVNKKRQRMKNVINWFEIYTADFDRAKKFYTDVFRLNLTDLPVASDRHADMQYATFPADERSIGGALVKIEQAKPGYGGTLVYFASEEIDAELGRVETAGGKILRPKTNIGEFGFIALIEDTEGNLIGLHSSR